MSQQKYDAKRTRFLNDHGFDVLRYWNNQVALQLHAVLEDIHRVVHKKLLLISSSCPSPSGEGTGGLSDE